MDAKSVAAAALQLERHLTQGTAQLGSVVERNDIRSAKAPFRAMPSYTVIYPKVVVQALFELYREYNECFRSLITQNREWDTDYQFCFDESGNPVNRWVQIDMVGLPDSFLSLAAGFSVQEVKEALRHFIFEVENSLAMYQLLERVTPSTGFRDVFRASLTDLRVKHGMPIALLAVTEDKYRALCAEELGLSPEEMPTDELVRELTGFDRLFHPEQFRKHVADNGGHSGYLLYVRSSDPTQKLSNPDRVTIQHPLLSDPEMRRTIRSCALTININDPDEKNPERLINDTKAYMPHMRMGWRLRSIEDLYAPSCLEAIRSGKMKIEDFGREALHPGLHDYLVDCGVDPLAVVRGQRRLRVKPLQGTYGCYGHKQIQFNKGKHRRDLGDMMRKWGHFVLQPELPIPHLVDPATGQTYGYIDRNFVTQREDGSYGFMLGFRSMLPLESDEAGRGRYHGNEQTVWAAVEG